MFKAGRYKKRHSIYQISRQKQRTPRAIWRRIPIRVRKIFIALLSVFALGFVIWSGYRLFTHQTTPVNGTLAFLTSFVFLIWINSLLRKRSYRYIKPSYKMVFGAVIGILLVFAFAGIEPFSIYKDRGINWLSVRWEATTTEVASLSIEGTDSFAIITESETTEHVSLLEVERDTCELINLERVRVGAPATEWDDDLYELSKAHTQAMSERGYLFHSPEGATYGENCWGGTGYYQYDSQEIAEVIVASWMSSPLHKAWILHEPIRSAVVSIVLTPEGQYASWTFWMDEAGTGPEIIERLSNEWRRETGGNVPWIEWLISKGYLY